MSETRNAALIEALKEQFKGLKDDLLSEIKDTKKNADVRIDKLRDKCETLNVEIAKVSTEMRIKSALVAFVTSFGTAVIIIVIQKLLEK